MAFRLWGRRRIGTVLTAAAVSLAAGVAAIATPATAQAQERGPDHITVLNDLFEKIGPNTIHTVTGPYPSVGDYVDYIDYLYDPSGREIGVVHGFLAVVEHRASDGHYIDYATERIDLPGGQITDAGLFDLTEAFGHQWSTLPTWGTGGRYLGDRGTRYFQIITPGVDLNARIVLYRR